MKYLPILLLIVSILLMATPCFGIPWLSITSASIEKLDADSYRLQVGVNRNVYDHSGDVYYSWYQFSHFELNLLGDYQYNPTYNSSCPGGYNSPGQWFVGFIEECDLINGVYGYDFDVIGGLGYEPITMGYYANFIEWERPLDGGFPNFTGRNHSERGSFTITSQTPEPSTFMLLGLGLLGIIGVTRQF